MNTISRWWRIGRQWLFDTEELVGYRVIDKNPAISSKGKVTKVSMPDENGNLPYSEETKYRSTRLRDPSKLAIEKAYKLDKLGRCTSLIAVPVGVIRKSKDILARQRKVAEKTKQLDG